MPDIPRICGNLMCQILKKRHCPPQHFLSHKLNCREVPSRTTMRDDIPKKEIRKLRLQRDAKFEEIVSCLGRELYTPAPSAADREYIIEEAEELTDQWAVADANNRVPEVRTELQVLLSQHQEICKHIIKLIDSSTEPDER